MGEEQQDNSKTRFNAGIAKLMRIDKIKGAIHECRVGEQYDNWLDFLIGWRNEINEKFNADMESEADKYEKDIVQAKQ